LSVISRNQQPSAYASRVEKIGWVLTKEKQVEEVFLKFEGENVFQQTQEANSVRSRPYKSD